MSSHSKHGRTALPFALGLAIAGCGGGDAEPEAAPEPQPAPAPPAAAETPPADVITDLREITFAPELEVNLDEMELRESGLYVQVLKGGSGPPAGYGDEMGVHYTLWLPNGSKIDSSHDHDPPEPYGIVLGSSSLIDGWVEGVTGMRHGERRRLVIPYDLGYGATGNPPIPPYSPLVFIVELAEHIPTGEG
ncbi:MAG: FKBP-type peptidyl-prolyl cis-trans isomerase [Gemmatimonadetes bacterium]|nr:FKBP-type peptidyl-prolyl cis-trans isomerase [Gemmatimonadota bacterium]